MEAIGGLTSINQARDMGLRHVVWTPQIFQSTIDRGGKGCRFGR
jgi:hypothetical protein